MAELPSLPQPRLDRYRHYRGGEYEVVGVARRSETLEPLVLYALQRVGPLGAALRDILRAGGARRAHAAAIRDKAMKKSGAGNDQPASALGK